MPLAQGVKSDKECNWDARLSSQPTINFPSLKGWVFHFGMLILVTKPTMNKKIKKYLNKANSFLNDKKFKNALPLYMKVVDSDDSCHEAHYGIAACYVNLQKEEKVDLAITHITKALKLNPTSQYLDCAAILFLYKDNYDVALHYQRQATKLEQTTLNIFNLSDMYKKLGMHKEAIDTVLPLLNIHLENKLQIAVHLAYIYLTCGYYQEGWKYWESRRMKKNLHRTYESPYWNGEDLTGKTIFLYGEQGFGDIIQFSRFILTLKERYSNLKIIYESSDPLKRLFEENFPLDEIIHISDRPKGFDYHCSLLSLPYKLNIEVHTIPYKDGYVRSNVQLKEHWHHRIGSDKKLKVGLVWHGQDATKTNVDTRRNIPLSQLEPIILETKDKISWYSLQKDIKPHRKELLLDYTDEFQDFSDTAAFIENLDLVITVDTAVAHLSGSLGVKTWVLSRMDGCWRWGTPNRNSWSDPIYHSNLSENETPWYNFVQVFRQTTWLNWDTALEDVGFSLKKVTSPKKKRSLPDVTLAIVDCVNYERAKKVIDHCGSFFDFKDVKILTHFQNEQDSRIINIPKIETIEEYSHFCIKELGNYFNTSHILVVQHDGFIIEPQMWSDEFLQYDYIGAPWSQTYPDSLMFAYRKGWLVGNGGFSLRSKRLYDALNDLNPTTTHCEDTILGIHLRDTLEKQYEIKFAPNHIAAKFSTENYVVGITRNMSFGQHGQHAINPILP